MLSKFSPRSFKRLLNFYPPYLGAGVKVTHISEDWRELHVSMPMRWYNRNAVGTHFGGNLYSMIDPHLMLLLMQLLGTEYIVWDKSASIEFIKATRKRVSSVIRVTEEELTTIRQQVAKRGKFLPSFSLEIRDTDDVLVARVNKELYVRKKPARLNSAPGQ